MDGQEDEEEEEAPTTSAKKSVGGGGGGKSKGVNGNGSGKSKGGGSKVKEREMGTDVKSLLGRIKKLERSVYEVSGSLGVLVVRLRLRALGAGCGLSRGGGMAGCR